MKEPVREALTDSEYLLAMIDETFAQVPQVKAHHDRMRKIAAALAALPVPRPDIPDVSVHQTESADKAGQPQDGSTERPAFVLKNWQDSDTPCPGCNDSRLCGPCCDDCCYQDAPRGGVAGALPASPEPLRPLWHAVLAEANAISNGRGIGDLTTAVLRYTHTAVGNALAAPVETERKKDSADLAQALDGGGVAGALPAIPEPVAWRRNAERKSIIRNVTEQKLFDDDEPLYAAPVEGIRQPQDGSTEDR